MSEILVNCGLIDHSHFGSILGLQFSLFICQVA